MKSFVFWGLSAMAAIGAGILAVPACSDNKTTKDGGADGSFVGCHDNALTPGTYPDPSCDPALIDNSCTKGAGMCMIDPKCGSQDTCLPLSSNAGKNVLDFRMRRLDVVAPQALKGLQQIVIDKGVLLHNVCGESQDGTFSWLMRVDKTANTLTTGGAPPGDPFATYCFFRGTANGLQIQPVTVKITFNGKTFSSDILPSLNIPIFILNNPNPVILPVRGAKINSATIDPDDCIGKFQKDALDSKCQELDYSTCARWSPNASLGGYITLDDADKVDVRETSQTLCAQLTGDKSGGMVAIDNGQVMIAHCGHQGGDMMKPVTAKGDYCSTTGKPGDCADSFWLAATFAASAAKIEEPSQNPMCQGGGSMDAGVDAAKDASSD
jgi:hypothetical protein